MTKGDFLPGTSAYGLRLGEFEELTPATKKKLVRMMARIMERAYRRGVQHGAEFEMDPKFRSNLHKWRYLRSLDKSPGILGGTTPSLERLEIEESTRDVGLSQ